MIAKLILISTVGAIWVYILLRGVFKFFTEAVGTLVLSPLIYVRLSPAPLSEWLIRMCAHQSGFNTLLCAIPVLIFLASLIVGIFAYQRRSIALAVISSTLISSIFIVYHCVKHLGLTVVEI